MIMNHLGSEIPGTGVGIVDVGLISCRRFCTISDMATVGRVVLFKIMSHASLPWHHNTHLNLLGSADKVGVGWALYILRLNNIMAPEM